MTDAEQTGKNRIRWLEVAGIPLAVTVVGTVLANNVSEWSLEEALIRVGLPLLVISLFVVLYVIARRLMRLYSGYREWRAKIDKTLADHERLLGVVERMTGVVENQQTAIEHLRAEFDGTKSAMEGIARARQLADQRGELAERMREHKLRSLPAKLQRAVAAAERVGWAVEVGSTTVEFYSPDGRAYQIDLTENPNQSLDQTLSLLAAQGVPIA